MQLVWIGIWSWFGGDWSGFKRNKWKKWQKEVENYVFPFRMIMQNFCTVMRNGSKGNFSCNSKGNLKADFAWPCENFTQSCEMLQEGEIGVDAFFTSHNRTKLHFSRFSLSLSLYNSLLSFIFSYFLTSQTCLVRPNLQAWVTKSHFSLRREDLEARSMVN